MIHSPRSVCEINLKNLKHNYRLLSGLAGEFCCPMVKANAYGHGAVEVSRALVEAGASILGVAFIEEALELRQAGIKIPILIFGGFELETAQQLFDYDLTPVIANWEQIRVLESLHQSRALGVHLKFNTGMHRLGFQSDQAQALSDYFWKNKSLRLKALLTHLASGDDIAEAHSTSAEQLREFIKLAQAFSSLKPALHALASAPILSLHRAETLSKEQQSWLSLGSRLGLALYGVSPIGGDLSIDLRPVMALRAQVTMVQKVAKGERVSYGGTWEATKDTYVAVIPYGYADGLPRNGSGKMSFRVQDQKYQQVGRVCMDFCMIDLNTDSEAAALKMKGQEVTIFDENPRSSIAEIAKAADTIAYEVMIRVGRRVSRRYT